MWLEFSVKTVGAGYALIFQFHVRINLEISYRFQSVDILPSRPWARLGCEVCYTLPSLARSMDLTSVRIIPIPFYAHGQPASPYGLVIPTPTVWFSSRGSLSGTPYTVADEENTSLRHPSCFCMHSTRFRVPWMLFLTTRERCF